MKRYLILLFIFVVLLSSCSLSTKSTELKQLSAEDTIKYYFDCYSKNDLSGMNRVRYKKIKREEIRFNEIVSVKLISCKEEEDSSKIPFSDLWYDGTPYTYTLVRTKYDIQFKKGTDQPIDNGENYCDYYLVKETKDSTWIIVMAGLG